MQYNSKRNRTFVSGVVLFWPHIISGWTRGRQFCNFTVDEANPVLPIRMILIDTFAIETKVTYWVFPLPLTSEIRGLNSAFAPSVWFAYPHCGLWGPSSYHIILSSYHPLRYMHIGHLCLAWNVEWCVCVLCVHPVMKRYSRCTRAVIGSVASSRKPIAKASLCVRLSKEFLMCGILFD